MTTRTIPELSKWPFFVGDLLLLGIAGWIVKQGASPLEPWPLFFVAACVGVGAWIGVAPFILEYRAKMKFAEAEELTDAVKEVRKMEAVGGQVETATAQWYAIQEHAERAVQEAKSIAERMSEESKGFIQFMEKANDAEKNHLRLEVDKLRRTEGDWLQVSVRVLDHVHALFMAGERSGQENLRQQLNNFQVACRETVRRLGLVPIDAQVGQPFDPDNHEVAEGQPEAQPESVVAEVIAAGYTFQGQLIRKAVVKAESATGAAAVETLVPEQAAEEEVAAGPDSEPGAGIEIEGLSPADLSALQAEAEAETTPAGEDSSVDSAPETAEQDDLIHWSTEEEISDRGPV